MPSFTISSPNITRSGLCCEIIITPSLKTQMILKQQGQQIPSIKVLALIDTGASGTAVSDKVVQHLHLVARGVTNISTPSTASHPVNVYDASLSLPNHVRIDNIPVIGANLSAQNIDCLIGRDILKHAVLIYNGYTQTFTLSF